MKPFLLLVALASFSLWAASPAPALPTSGNYTSPYVFSANVTDSRNFAYFNQSPRNNFKLWSTSPYTKWTDFKYIKSLDSLWGPDLIDFIAPSAALNHTTDARPDWFLIRLFAAANSIRGTIPYAHHHLQAWDVPDTAQWKNAGYATGQGIDCSDFTHWAYSYGLGISFDSAVIQQAQTSNARFFMGPKNYVTVTAQRLFDVHNGYTKDYANLTANLQPGDLLFIRGDPPLDRPITHVIMFLGNYATDTNHQDPFLVMDSHGAVVTDSNGNTIPSGPEIRPFRSDSYYYSSFDHVLRFFNTTAPTLPFSTSKKPAIIVDPTPVNSPSGTTIHFGVRALGTAPLAYVWKFNGTPLADGGNITGASTHRVYLAHITSANAGNYTCTVSNKSGSVTSNPAQLIVERSPGKYTSNLKN